MSTRLKVRLVIAGIGLIIYLIIGMINPSRVTFSPANMSIDPGKGWKVVKIRAMPPVCTPRLLSKFGMINAMVLDEDFTEAKAAAEKLQANLVASGAAPANEFNQQEFTTATGLAGVHFSYTSKSTKSDTAGVVSHHFITRNMLGRCVSISFITSTDVESAAVLESIRKTLRVE
jgi:hypothetical protein